MTSWLPDCVTRVSRSPRWRSSASASGERERERERERQRDRSDNYSALWLATRKLSSRSMRCNIASMTGYLPLSLQPLNRPHPRYAPHPSPPPAPAERCTRQHRCWASASRVHVLTRVVGVRLIERVRVRIDSSAASIHASRARTLRQRCEPYERLSDMPIARLRDIAATRELQTKWACHPVWPSGRDALRGLGDRQGGIGSFQNRPPSTLFAFLPDVSLANAP